MYFAMIFMSPFQGFLRGRGHWYPGRCPGLMYFALSGLWITKWECGGIILISCEWIVVRVFMLRFEGFRWGVSDKIPTAYAMD